MIGIFGGTFDPVHLGHLRLALELYEQGLFSEIRFIPCYQPVHKDMPQATPEQRLAMLQLAIADQPGFIADDREIRRATPSYMIDTLTELQRAFPGETFSIIIGQDALSGFTQWQRWQDILSLANLTVVPREQFSLSINHLPLLLQEKISLHPLQTLPISSSAIRETIAIGHSARYWVPDSVWAYIQTQHLYR